MVLLQVSDAVAGQLPNDEEKWKAYLEETQVLPSLECGLEEMLRACADAAGSGRRKDPINFLASWLMRHNPRHNPAMAQHLVGMASATAERLAKEKAEEEAAIAFEAERIRLETERAERKAAEQAAAIAEAEAAKLKAARDKLRPFVELELADGVKVLLRVKTGEGGNIVSIS